jgi:hypothetical protein
MANQRNTNRRRPASGASSGRRSNNRQPSSGSRNPRRRVPQKQSLLSRLLELRPKPDFKPDSEKTDVLKLLHLTKAQRDTYLKWGLYIALIVILCMIQDVIMSQVSIFGATTDLAVCAIFLIGLYEGTENGSLFALLASIVYLFSGSSPGAQCVAMIACPVVGLNLMRQSYWRRSGGSILLCTCAGIVIYEMLNFLFGIFVGNTIWARAGVFLLVAILTCICAFPLYPLVKLISKIGGDTWKE